MKGSQQVLAHPSALCASDQLPLLQESMFASLPRAADQMHLSCSLSFMKTTAFSDALNIFKSFSVTEPPLSVHGGVHDPEIKEKSSLEL